MTADISELEGCTDAATYALLYEMAQYVPAKNAIVEIGTYRGKSACHLAAGARDGRGAHVWTIDPHDLPGERHPTGARPNLNRDYTDPEIRQDAESQICRSGLDGWITMVRDFSTVAAGWWPGPPVSLLFVDGDHRREAVNRDFRAWESHLAAGALVVFDDFSMSHPGVPYALLDLVNAGVLRIADTCGRVAVCEVVRGGSR